MDNNGEQVKVFLEANPKYKTLNVYDEHFKMLKHDDLPKVEKSQTISQGHTASVKTETPNQEVKQSKGQKQGQGLLSKKRTRQNKGFTIK